MNARATEPKPGEATVVNIPRAEKSMPRAEAPQSPPSPQAPQQAAAAPVAAPKKRGSRRLILMIVVPLVLVVAGAWFYLTGGRYEDTDNAYVNQAKVLAERRRCRPHHRCQRRREPVGQDRATCCSPSIRSPTRSRSTRRTPRWPAPASMSQQLKVAYGTAQVQLKSAQATLAIQQATYRPAAGTGEARRWPRARRSTQPKLALQQAQTAVDRGNPAGRRATAALGGDPNIAIDKHPAVLAAQAAGRSGAAQPQQDQGGVAGRRHRRERLEPQCRPVRRRGHDHRARWSRPTAPGSKPTSRKRSSPTSHVGQPAEVSVDAYPGTLDCKVASLGAATGAEFSLIPAQNATGNWVKVVQRVPVRIECRELARARPAQDRHERHRHGRHRPLDARQDARQVIAKGAGAKPRAQNSVPEAGMAKAPIVQHLTPPTIVVKHKGLLTVALMLGTVMQVLDTTIANVALPHMAASLGAAQNEIVWVLTSYIVAAAIATPLTGWVSRPDRAEAAVPVVGHRLYRRLGALRHRDEPARNGALPHHRRASAAPSSRRSRRPCCSTSIPRSASARRWPSTAWASWSPRSSGRRWAAT